MSTAWLQLTLFLLCVAGIAVFEGIEIALVAADRLRLRSAPESRRMGAEISLDLLQRRESVLVTLLVGSTLASSAAAALATSLVEDRLGPTASTTLIATLVVTVILLVFGQILPKSFGQVHPESILIRAARPLFAFDLLLLPATAGAGFVVSLVLRILRRGRRDLITREEMRVLIRDVRVENATLLQEKKMLQSILDFGQTTAREVMVPMPSVVSIEKDASVDLLRSVVRRRAITRVPVFDRRVDRVVGVVHVFDVLLDPGGEGKVEDFMRPITLVPETKRIDRLMVEMQKRGESMVVVINEFGSCTGIVTIEDIVEEIMGEFADEHEVSVRRIRSLGGTTYIVDALTDIDDLNEELGLHLPKLRYDTVGGLVMRRLGRIPQEGETFEFAGVIFEVVEVYPFGVRTVKLTLNPGEDESR
jgi:CBS domain containing-hemolysin-like protein